MKTKKYWRKKKREGGPPRSLLYLMIAVLAVLVLVFGIRSCRGSSQVSAYEASGYDSYEEYLDAVRPELDVQLLTVNSYSRPGISLDEVNGIVIHYTANPGTSAQANRDYFEGLKDSQETKASAHFIIGLEGEIIQCIPTAEMAYASNSRNSDTLSIECCYENEDGSFNQETYDSLVELTAWLCAKFDLTSDDVIRHYDITGKLCPVYYVENEDAWEEFLEDVDAALSLLEP